MKNRKEPTCYKSIIWPVAIVVEPIPNPPETQIHNKRHAPLFVQMQLFTRSRPSLDTDASAIPFQPRRCGTHEQTFTTFSSSVCYPIKSCDNGRTDKQAFSLHICKPCQETINHYSVFNCPPHLATIPWTWRACQRFPMYFYTFSLSVDLPNPVSSPSKLSICSSRDWTFSTPPSPGTGLLGLDRGTSPWWWGKVSIRLVWPDPKASTKYRRLKYHVWC